MFVIQLLFFIISDIALVYNRAGGQEEFGS